MLKKSLFFLEKANFEKWMNESICLDEGKRLKKFWAYLFWHICWWPFWWVLPFRGSCCQEYARLQNDAGREEGGVGTLVSWDSDMADFGLVLLRAPVGVTFISGASNPEGHVNLWIQGHQSYTKNLTGSTCVKGWATAVVLSWRIREYLRRRDSLRLTAS